MNRKIIFTMLSLLPTIAFSQELDQKLSSLSDDVNNLSSKLTQNIKGLSDSLNYSFKELDDLKADKSHVRLIEDEISDLKERKVNNYDFESEHYDRVDVENNLYDIKADKSDLKKTQDGLDAANNSITSINNHNNLADKKIEENTNLSYINSNDISTLNKKVNQNTKNNQIMFDKFDEYDLKFEKMNNHVRKLEKESRSGISSAIAMANIPTTSNIGKFNLGIGVGSFKDASSLAIGSSYRFNQYITSKFSIANSNDTTSFGAGMSYDF